jgi:hypothetical protein
MGITAAILGGGALIQQNQAQKQQRNQFQQQAQMEQQRQQQELQLGMENLAMQQAALNSQNEAFMAQQAAAEKAQADAKKAATLSDIANNRAMRKAPNIGAMLTGNDKAGSSGAGSTLLTGAGGATGGTLGRTSLLGS